MIEPETDVRNAPGVRKIGKLRRAKSSTAHHQEKAMRTVMSQIEVCRSFQGTDFKIPVEVWSTPEGVCARSLASIFYRDGARAIMLVEAEEDPQLNENEMGLAEESLWVVKSFDPHVP